MKRKRPVQGVLRRYSWRLYPNQEQDQALRRQAAMCAQLWNALLEIWETIDRRMVQRLGGGKIFHNPIWYCGSDGPKLAGTPEQERVGAPSEFDIGNWISALRTECTEWKELSTWTPRRVASSLVAAFKAFFRRAKEGAGAQSGYPMYKSTRDHGAVPHRTVSGCIIAKSSRHERSWTLSLKGVSQPIWARGHLPAEVHEWTDVDVMFRAGKWEASVAVDISARRVGLGGGLAVVKFDLIDGLASVNGTPATPQKLFFAQRLQDRYDELKSAHDLKFPRGRLPQEQYILKRMSQEKLTMFAAYIARVRKDCLHVWTANLVRSYGEITVIIPPLQPVTPRGNEKDWGAAVEAVSKLNRSVYSFAPGAAASMLKYKSDEAKIVCTIITDEDPSISVGPDLVAATKTVRQSRRSLNKQEDDLSWLTKSVLPNSRKFKTPVSP